MGRNGRPRSVSRRLRTRRSSHYTTRHAPTTRFPALRCRRSAVGRAALGPPKRRRRDTGSGHRRFAAAAGRGRPALHPGTARKPTISGQPCQLRGPFPLAAKAPGARFSAARTESAPGSCGQERLMLIAHIWAGPTVSECWHGTVVCRLLNQAVEVGTEPARCAVVARLLDGERPGLHGRKTRLLFHIAHKLSAPPRGGCSTASAYTGEPWRYGLRVRRAACS